MIYVVKNNGTLLSADEIELNMVQEYMKSNNIHQFYLVKKSSKTKFDRNNLDQLIDGEFYGVQVDIQDFTTPTIDDKTNQIPTIPTTIDETARCSTTDSGADFASAILEFIQGCDRIFRHSQDIQQENRNILDQIKSNSCENRNILDQIKSNSDENRNILDQVKSNSEETRKMICMSQHMLDQIKLSHEEYRNNLHCLIKADERIAELRADLTDVLRIAQTNQKVLMKVIGVQPEEQHSS